jgi:hypothetical protein
MRLTVDKLQVGVPWQSEECSDLLRRGRSGFVRNRSRSPLKQGVDVTLELVECVQACRHRASTGAVRLLPLPMMRSVR